MNTVKINKENVKMIAHRGLSGLEPENSIQAFIAAGNHSHFGVETDVHVTKDGKFVIIHDDNTERVSGEHVVVEETDYDELRKIRLKNLCKLEILNQVEKEDVKDRIDLVIPNLKEYITICQKYEKTCILELKNPFAVEDIAKLVDEIKEYGYLDQVVFISFALENLIELRRLLPEQEIQYLVKAYDSEVLEALNQYGLELDIRHAGLTKEIVDEVHANGHKVNCWTCDDSEKGELLVSWGVDYITSNILE